MDAPRERFLRVSDQEKRYLLWARSERQTPRDVYRRIRIKRRTYCVYWYAAKRDPTLFARWGCVVYIEYGEGMYWACRFCVSAFQHRDVACRHAWMHVFQRELIWEGLGTKGLLELGKVLAESEGGPPLESG